MPITHYHRGEPGDILQYLVRHQNDNTLRILVQYPGALDAAALCAAAGALVGSAEVLHSAFAATELGGYWKPCAPAKADYFRLVRVEGSALEAALELAAQPIRPEEPVKLRVTLVDGADGSVLLLHISHLVVDGSDGKYLLRKLAEAYSLILRSGSAQGLEVKNGDRGYRQAYGGLPLWEYARHLKELKGSVSQVSSRFPYPSAEPGQPQILCTRIPAEVFTAARQRAKAQGASANDLLLAACYRALGGAEGADPAAPAGITSMMDLRRHCPGGDSAGLCNLSGSFATAVTSCGGSFAEILDQVAAQTAQVKRDPMAGLYALPLAHISSQALPLGVLLRIADRAYGALGLGLTNLGALRGEELRMGDALPSGMYFGAPVKQKPSFQAAAVTLDGACTLSVCVCADGEDAQAVRSFLHRMVQEVGGYARG